MSKRLFKTSSSRGRESSIRKTEPDRDDELLATIRHESMDENGRFDAPLIERPLVMSSDGFMGKMPKADRILKKDVLWKLSSALEWRPLQVALTTAGLFMAKPDEDTLRDLIPLYEIRDVKRKSEVPQDFGNSRRIDSLGGGSDVQPASRASLLRNMATRHNMQEAQATELYMIQVRTVEAGYNSGRTYYFDTRSEELCTEWLQLLRKEADQAVVQKMAGPSVIQKLRFRLRRFYWHVVVQSTVALLIFLCFIVNILQTELSGNGGSDDETDGAFAVLEYFFTLSFLLELLINMSAHWFYPFIKVSVRLKPVTEWNLSSI